LTASNEAGRSFSGEEKEKRRKEEKKKGIKPFSFLLFFKKKTGKTA
jgi:hypothetical protein